MPSDAPPRGSAGERRLHPFTLLFAALAVARQLVFPALVGGFSAAGGDFGRGFAWVLVILSVPGLLIAAAQYAAFRFRLAGDELVLRSGVLNRQHRVIPLARVQNVEVRQNPLHRVLRMAEVRVETAGGSGKAEASFSVLAEADARALRRELLARRTASAPAAVASAIPAPETGDAGAAAPAATVSAIETAAETPAGPPLVRLSTGDLALAGATASEVGVIAALLGGAMQFLDESVWFERLVGSAADAVTRTGAGVALLVAALAFVVLIVGWVVSILGAIVRYHGYTLHREGGDLRGRYGLLTLHEPSVPLKRVQAVRIEESLLRRPFALAAVRIETAGGAAGVEQQGGAEAFIPIATRSDLPRLLRGVFGDLDYGAVQWRRVDPRSRLRAAIASAVWLVLLTTPLWVAAVLLGRPGLLLGLLVLVPFPFVSSALRFASTGWALLPGYVAVRGGVFTRLTWIVPDRKLQTLHVMQGPLQRAFGLASLVFDTAAGGRHAIAPDLGERTADVLLAEASRRALEARRASRRHAHPAAPPVAGAAEAADPHPARGADR